MKDFIFENAEFKELKYCSDEEALQIFNAKRSGLCERWCDASCGWVLSDGTLMNFNAVYRVPTPNEIDWGQFPPWVKCCATDNDGKTYIYSAGSDQELIFDGKDWRLCDWLSDCNQIEITDFPGFKRGTVAPKNSLLIRLESK